ncbi:MAG: hypothetical protein ACK4ZY_12990 [Sphingomonas sp.]|jgi:hypothetical protein
MTVALVFVTAFPRLLVSAVADGGTGLAPRLRLILPVASISGALSIGNALSGSSK